MSIHGKPSNVIYVGFRHSGFHFCEYGNGNLVVFLKLRDLRIQICNFENRNVFFLHHSYLNVLIVN